MTDQAYENTDRELWREPGDADGAGSYYMPSIHVTAQGGVGINVDGTVIVRTLREWHALAEQAEALRGALTAARVFAVEVGKWAARPEPVMEAGWVAAIQDAEAMVGKIDAALREAQESEGLTCPKCGTPTVRTTAGRLICGGNCPDDTINRKEHHA